MNSVSERGVVRELNAFEISLVSGGDITVYGHRPREPILDFMERISIGLGWFGDATGAASAYLTATAVAQGGADLPNDALAAGLGAASLAAMGTRYVFDGAVASFAHSN